MEESGKQKRAIYVHWFFIRAALILFDILAVNFSYFIALVIRFYVNHEFNIWAVSVPAFLEFAPWYTVACLVVFGVFRLYNNRWKYAGLNDLNRIAAANVVTAAVQIVGSMMFVLRMPVTYYVIGAMIQFFLIASSRFSYRMFLMERSHVRGRRKGTTVPVMIVGVGDTSNVVRHHLDREDSATQPVCLVDFRGKEFGNMLGGVPVVSGVAAIPGAIKKYGVECVILADNTMSGDVRKTIRDICAEQKVDVQDFSGYFQADRGPVTLRGLMEYAKGEVELVIDGQSQSFANGEKALMATTGKYLVKAVAAKNNRLMVELRRDSLVPNDVKEDWVQTYEKETGNDISFF